MARVSSLHTCLQWGQKAGQSFSAGCRPWGETGDQGPGCSPGASESGRPVVKNTPEKCHRPKSAVHTMRHPFPLGPAGSRRRPVLVGCRDRDLICIAGGTDTG